MILFLLKGILRDRSRSLFPVLIVAVGVMLSVFLHAYVNGAMNMLIGTTARFTTGHVRVMSAAYAKEAEQIPNDLALLHTDSLVASLRSRYPELHWMPRIRFGGLLDVPDDSGETLVQSPAFGIAVDLLDRESPEWTVMNIRSAIVRGNAPVRPGEVLIADELARRLRVEPGMTVTLIGSTMNGSMAFTNFRIAGTIRFGITGMDRGTILADIQDIRQAMDMPGGAGEILGLFRDDVYHEERADAVTAQFNAQYAGSGDEFAPVMGTFRTGSGMAEYLDIIGMFNGIIIGIFIFAMSIVLWNTGLTGSLRRYGEYGVRLAIGEDHAHVYRSIMAESVIIGIIGSLIGTALGLAVAYYVQEHGIDLSGMMKNSTLLMTDVIRARITPFTYIIGFLPGVLATLIGSAISGIGIYKRKTASLFKELET